jgi:sn-glycerol 3-phosphate transport system substrate-binding protein
VKKFFLPLLLCCSALFSTEITLWHAFDGYLGEVFDEIVSTFNQQASGDKVLSKKVGTYKQVFEEGMASFETENHPHILQVYEVATLTAMQTPKCFFPVEELFKQYSHTFDPSIYIPTIRNLYTTEEGRMFSLPWNASAGVLYYNKEAFKEAGLNPEEPPKTWEEFERCCRALKKKGWVGYTTAWPAAYHLEHLCCLHNVPFATKGNGLKGINALLNFHKSNLPVYHLTKVAKWKEKGYFQYTGRYNEEPEKLFASKGCAMLLQGANRYQLIKRQADFTIGAGPLPYWNKMLRKPYPLNVGGSSFWAMRGFTDQEYRVVAAFLEHLSSAKIQAYWHQKTGYLPIAEEAYHLSKKMGYYEQNPAAEVALLQVMRTPSTLYTRGIRLPHYIEVRDKIIDTLEKIFDGRLEPKEGLDQAAKEGNEILTSY